MVFVCSDNLKQYDSVSVHLTNTNLDDVKDHAGWSDKITEGLNNGFFQLGKWYSFIHNDAFADRRALRPFWYQHIFVEGEVCVREERNLYFIDLLIKLIPGLAAVNGWTLYKTNLLNQDFR